MDRPDDGLVSEMGATVTAPAGATSPGAGGATGLHGGLPVVDRGHYRFDGVLAQGGMGKIFRAHDRRLGREVAIKELLTSSAQLAARFEREVRITARLQHPSIVGLHEAGVWTTGEPFFAMKLVAGRPLDEVIRATRDVAARLALLPHVLAVADALAYAHASRIIHRDLKPHNVLVGSFGETVVIDWGLAKDLRDGDSRDGASASDRGEPTDVAAGSFADMSTRHGAVMGTPAYMPPEQAAGERVDERSDVYAIGAMLYHLTAGYPPYFGGSSDEIVEAVRQGPALRAAEAAPDAPAELMTIVEKAMARAPADRYRDAGALADDLRAFLHGKLVGAHRYTLRALLGRWVRRHRAVVAVSAAALVTLAVVSALGVSRIVDERDTARRAEEKAHVAGAVAEHRRAEAETQHHASEELVAFMLEDLEPQLARVGRQSLLGGIGARIDRYYAQAAGDDAAIADPAVRARRAEALTTVGDVLDSAGDLAGARRAFERAIALREPAALAGDPAAVRDVAGARSRLAVTLQQLGERDAAMAQLEQGRAALEAVAGRDAASEVELATLYRRLGAMTTGAGDLDGAAEFLVRGRARAEAALAARPGDRAAAMEAAKVEDRLSDVYRLAGEQEKSQRAAEAGLALRRALVARDPGDLEAQMGLSVSWDKLYALAIRADDQVAAAKAAAEGLAAIAPLAARDPDNGDWNKALTIALLRPVDLADAKDDLTGALAGIDRVIEVAERGLARAPGNLDLKADLSTVLTRRGSYQARLGRLKEAVATQRRAVALSLEASNADPADRNRKTTLAAAYEYLGDALLAGGDAAAAADAYQARVVIQEEAIAVDPSNVILDRVLRHARFMRASAWAYLPARRADGLRDMQDILATFDADLKAGKLEGDWIEGIAGYHRTLKTAQAATPR